MKAQEESIQIFDEEEENKEIARRYRTLLRHAKPIMEDGDMKIVRKAIKFAIDAHEGMRRKSGEPYIFHPLEVARICVDDIGLGTTSIIAALLHDVVEDTEIDFDDIEREFGEKVAQIIDGLTKISGVFEQGSSQQAENFRKMILTLSDDVRVILIKLADRLHNMRTLESMPRDKQLKIASETIYIYAPLAHRLGLYSMKMELEDLYLKYTNEEVYNEISHKLEETKDARDRFVREFLLPLRRALKDQGIKPVMKARLKSVFSIWNKMQKQDVPFEEVFDVFAIRIIYDVAPEEEKAMAWKIYSIVTDYYQPNPDRLRDWISTPKSNGYEALHTTVMSKLGQWVEVQIRSKRMDEIAERGYAAHWKYKESKDGQESGLDVWLGKVREMLEQHHTSAIEFVNDFRRNLFKEEVFVFTPNGDLKALPNGATVLDFAFDIHTQIGYNCIGAKVNQKLMPISYQLKNGDQLEVLTSQKQHPHEDWLKLVVTSKARSKIRNYLNEGKRRLAHQGREIVEKKLKNLKLSINQNNINRLVSHFNLRTPFDLYYRVGIGAIDDKDLKLLKDKKKPKVKPEVKENESRSLEANLNKVKSLDSNMLLIGEDLDKIDYTLSKCCNPIPGDDVFGFVTVGEGIKIHRTDCPNAAELMANYGYRIVKAKWTSQHELSFLAGLEIKGTDRVGMINNITEIISKDLKVNMRSITVDSVDGLFEGKIMVFVNNTEHLKTLISKLKSVPGVTSVTRFD